MTRAMTSRAAIVAALAMGLLLTASAPAQAIYMVTPLRLSTDTTTAQVGDELSFRVEPENETAAAEWAGRDVVVRYGYDANEKPADEQQDPDTPTSDSEVAWTKNVAMPRLALDSDAKASFTWVVPEDARDHNIEVTLENDAGEILGRAHLAIGNAPSNMRLMAGSGVAREDMSQENAPTTDAPPAKDTAADESADNNVPGIGAPLVLAAVGALALVAARRR